jgi:hypothetical protein
MSMCMPIINGTRMPDRHVNRDGQPVGRYWSYKGFLHRLAGPAVERANGSKHWWLRGNHHLSEDGDIPSRICNGSHEFPGYHKGSDWRYSMLTRRSQQP